MARKPDPARIDAARRAGIQGRLMAGGMSRELAETWCAAWEREAVIQGRDRAHDDYWDAGGAWIERECSARKRPEGREL